MLQIKLLQFFMITSVLSNNKDVIGLLPVRNLTADYLYAIINIIISQITNVGYEILCLISEDKVNRKAFALLCGSTIQNTIINSINGKPMFILFDTVHLFKSIPNNWFNQIDSD